MKRGHVLFTVLFLLLISTSAVSIVSAADSTTIVNLRTDDYLKTILIRLKDPNSAGVVFESRGVTTDAIGRASFEFITSRYDVQFLILYVEDGTVVKSELTDEYSTGGLIELDFRENPEEVIMLHNTDDVDENLTTDVVENATEEVEENNTIISAKTISGFTVVKDKIIGISALYYYIFGIFLVGAFITVFIMKKNKEPRKDPDVKIIKVEPKSIAPAESRILELERELEKAKAEVEVNKNQELKQQKIIEMKEKLEKDKEKLDDLQKEE